MATPLEQLVRRFFAVLADPDAVGVPPVLRESVLDHLSRTDNQGYTLCFYSPLREDLLDHILAWLHAIPKPQPGEQLWLRL
jgi:hypothetical protein